MSPKPMIAALVVLVTLLFASTASAQDGRSYSVAGFAGYQNSLVPEQQGGASVEGLLVGVRGGVEFVFAEKWRLAPSLGVSFDKDRNDGVFGDVALLYAFHHVYVGAGATAWTNDTGLDSNRFGYLATVGVPFHDDCLSIVAEWKHFLDKNDTDEFNSQAWAGLKYTW